MYKIFFGIIKGALLGNFSFMQAAHSLYHTHIPLIFHEDIPKDCRGMWPTRLKITQNKQPQKKAKGHNSEMKQEALNRSPEFCLKLTYRYLLKAGHVPDDTWGRANFGTRGHNSNKLGRGPLCHATYQISRL